MNATTGCAIGTSLTAPLYLPPRLTLSPCFIAAWGVVVTAALGLVVALQLVSQLWFNHYGPYKIKYAFGHPLAKRLVGFRQLVKLNSVALNVILWAILAANPHGEGAQRYLPWVVIVVHLVAVVPLHVIEPTRVVVASALLLVFWLWHSAYAIGLVLQDNLTKHPVVDFRGTDAQWTLVVLAAEIVLAINSVLVFSLETFVYLPSRELKDYYEVNGWDIDAVHNLFSRLVFQFIQPTISDVYRTNLIELKQVQPVEISFKNEVLQDDFDRVWTPKRKLGAVLFQLYWWRGLVAITFDFTDMALGIAQSFLLQRLILFFTVYDPKTSPKIEGFAICTAIFACSVAKFISFNQYFVQVFDLWYLIQSQLLLTVYRKLLRLSKASRKEKTNGDIVNILSLDVQSVAGSLLNLIDIIITPVRLVAALGALIHVLGVLTFAGLVIGCILLPLNSMVTMRIQKYYKQLQKVKDLRVRLTLEILLTIKLIKLYAWEKPLLQRLFDIRNDKELKLLRKMGLLNAVLMFCWLCVPFAIQCFSLIVFTYIGKVPLTPAVVFPALLLFGVLSDPFVMVPYLFTGVIQNNVLLGRLRELLTMEEANTTQVERPTAIVKEGEAAVVVDHATFAYGDGTDDLALKDITFSANKGQLTCIVGAVGAGKSLLIKSVLGQLPVTKARKVAVTGSVAYAAQDPWIMNATIKENILFGRRFHRHYYDMVCSACQLEADFGVLPDGDATVVGEKGISLSGGQKARISLARAVYSKADVILLDDVLLAVDVHVGKAISDQVLLRDGLLLSKTVIMATNAISVLPLAAQIYLVEGGEIKQSGSYDDVKDNGKLADLIKEFGKQEKQRAAEAEVQSKVQEVKDIRELERAADDGADAGLVVLYVGDDLDRQRDPDLRRQLTRASYVLYSHDYENDEDTNTQSAEARRTGNNEEVGAKGLVKLLVYLEYFKACNFGYLIFYVLLYGTHVLLNLLSQYTLKYWSERNLDAGHNVNAVFYVLMYAIFGIVAAVCTLLGAFIVWTYCTVRGLRYFHDKMAWSVVKLPMTFFDTTPIGRVLNRFSEDIGVIDSQIMWTCMGIVDFSLEALGLLAVVVYNLPAMLIVILVLFYVYNLVRRYYIPSLRELKRLLLARKSPIYAQLQELLNGIDTITAYSQINRFLYKNRENLDTLVKVQFSNAYCNRWLLMRLQMISAVIIYCTTVFIWLSLGTAHEFSPGLVGFVMINAMGVTWTLNSIIRFWANLENQAVAVERVVEYCNLPAEGQNPDDIVVATPPASWPAGGAIEFVNYSCKYRDNLDPVLKDINVKIPAEAKVGIVGRTGAGKLTLTMALFRMIEPATGHITIDGINTSDLSLYELRHHLNIIPQDANTVEGTVRENLDPLGVHNDEELWAVLAMAHLKDHVEQMKTKKGQTEESKDTPGTDSEDSSDDDTSATEWNYGLDAQIFEGGSNLSGGQRQLMSLARALLNKLKVLVLDEATAAVDMATDKIIQQTIREQFKDRTILTIAHRLDTVMDCDYIMVLSKGELVEFALPKELLANDQSVFYSMVKEHDG